MFVVVVGVVNVYKRPAGLLEPLLGSGLSGGIINGDATAGPVKPHAGRPLKALMNLTTAVDTLTFSPDSQVGWGCGTDCLAKADPSSAHVVVVCMWHATV